MRYAIAFAKLHIFSETAKQNDVFFSFMPYVLVFRELWVDFESENATDVRVENVESGISLLPPSSPPP